MMILDSFGIFIFSEEGAIKAKEVPLFIALILFTVSSIIFSLPANLVLTDILINFSASTMFLIIMFVCLYALLKVLGSDLDHVQFFSSFSVFIFLVSLSVITLVFIFLALGSLTGLTNLLLSSAASLITTYYPTVVFAYAVDSSSKLKGIKGIIAGVVALFLFLIYQHLLLLLS